MIPRIPVLAGWLSCFFVASAQAQPASTAGLINAAVARYGAKAFVEAGPGVVRDKQTGPDAYLDENHHSRYVLTGAPYTITVELPLKLKVERISFSQSDYATETAPKDIEVTFDDGQVVKQTLENTRPARRGRNVNEAWQDVPVGREIKSFKVTILNNYEGQVKWGGLGDIAVWTSVDLNEKFKVQGYDATAPVFIHTVSPITDVKVKVNLPEVVPPGQNPRLLFNERELADFKKQLETTERGKAAFTNFIPIADGGLKPPRFPSVEDTVANKAGKEHAGLANRAGSMGLAYALTGDKKYANAVRDILVGYADRYEGYPRHSGINRADQSKVTYQRLSEAMWIIPQLEAYDYTLPSGVYTDADKANIEAKLFRACVEEIRRKPAAAEVADRNRKDPNWRTTKPEKTKSSVGNWLNFFNTATMMTGSLLNDKDMMDLAEADFKGLIVNGIGDDGMWGEGAIGYQLFAMNAMAPGFEAAAHVGIDLWGFDNARFKQLFDSPLRYAYPDGTLPGINDSARGKLGSWQTMVYDYGYLRYGDPRYAFLVNDTQRQLHFSEGIYEPTKIMATVPEPPSVTAGSTLFENLGYAILRDTNTYALIDYGPHGGVHGHFDKLNLLLFAAPAGAKGDEMGGEPQFHFYDQAVHPEWVVQTIAHNTMAVDEKSQLAGDGKLLIYESTPELKLMRAESATSSPGVLLDRTVLTAGDVVIDLYAGRGSIPHTWDRTFRYNGKFEQLPATGEGKPLGKGDGYQHISVFKQEDAAKAWEGDWDTKAGKFTVYLAGAPTQQVFMGKGPDDDQIAVARQTGSTTADFAAVYSLDAWGNPVQSGRWLSKGDAAENGATAFEVAQIDGCLTRVLVAHKPGEWTAAGWKSDARVLATREKAGAMTILMGGGTYAQNGPLQVKQAAVGNVLAVKKGAALEVKSQWAPG